MKLRIKQLNQYAVFPRRAHPGDAGLDMAPTSRRDMTINPGDTCVMGTGFAIEIPDGHVGLMRSRSSTQLDGISISGVIDAGYRGEVRLIISNLNPHPVLVEGGEYIAQLVIVPCITPPIIEVVEELSETSRGAGSFGSTGK